MPRTSSLATPGRLALLVLILALSPAPAPAAFPEPGSLPVHSGLPDPLIMFDGEAVTSKEQWFERRRPELKALFEHYMYGVMPARPEKITFKVEREDRRALGGKATKKEVSLSFGPPEAPKISLLVVTPNGAAGPAPVFVGPNFCGNHTVLDDPSVALPTAWLPDHCPGAQAGRATDAGRGAQVDVWGIADSIDRGYAVATFYCGDIAPDHPGFTDGIQRHYWKEGQSRPGPDDWGAVAAWAWGVQRAVDYLRTDKHIDKDRIVAVGHSRLGKAVIVAAAFDERIALVIPHQAGCGGTAPSRSKVGESVKQINDRFPHWFDDVFKAFNDQPERLPFDQNGLIALVAPRAVLLTNATEDTWANPQGQFEVLRAADPVYRLLGVGGLNATEMPPVGELVRSRLGYHIRPGKHSMGKDDWKVFREYADAIFSEPVPSR